MAKVVILHLSDTHFKVEKPGSGKRTVNALISAVEKHVGEYGRPNLIIFSGDLVFSGTPAEFAAAEVWLKAVQERCGAPLFIVPGNHDVFRPKNRNSKYCRSLTYAQESEEKFNGHRTELAQAKFLANFRQWHARFKDQNKSIVVSDWSESPFYSEYVADLGGLHVVLIGLNTAVTSFQDSEEGALVCDANAIDEVLSKYDGQNSPVLSVVVTHHPVGFSTGRSGVIRCIADWNDSDLQERLLRGTGPHLYFHGHLHDQKGATLSLSSGQHLAILAAGAAYVNTKNYPLRYSFVEVDVDSRYIFPYVYSYSSRSGRWTLQNEESNQFLAALPKPTETALETDPIDPLTQVRALYQTMKGLEERLDDASRRKFHAVVQMDYCGTANEKPLEKVIAEFSQVGGSAPKKVTQAIRMVMTGKVQEGINIVANLSKNDEKLKPLLVRMLVASPLKEHWDLALQYLATFGNAFDFHALAYGYWNSGDIEQAISLSKIAVEKAKAEKDEAILIRSMSNLSYYYAVRGKKKDSKVAKSLAEESLKMVNHGEDDHKAMYEPMLHTTGFVLATYGGKGEIERALSLLEQAKSPTVSEELRQQHIALANQKKTAGAPKASRS